ncbi:MAG: hypothetical protein WA126_05125 [Thermodesulfovibrionales bacterium]
MINKNITALLKKNLCFFVMLVLLASTSGILSGCKEKASAPAPSVAPPKNIGQCEILDALPGDIAKTVEVNYGDKIKLLGITVNKQGNNKLKISYYWQLLNELGPYNKAFVILSDKNKKQITGNDHDLCENKPFTELKGKFIKETFMFGVPQSASGQKVDIGIGIFAPELSTNVRLKITSAGKTPVDDVNTRAVIQEITL